MRTKLSVITICYNDPQLQETCESITNQTFQDFEWVVIDGGSDQTTLDIFEKYKSRINVFVSEKDNGIYNAMNKGIQKANGDYILFMNSGDSFYDNKVLEDFINTNLDKDIYYFNCCWGNRENIRYYPEVLDTKFWLNDCINHQSSFIKRELFNKYGLYNEDYKIASDFEKWIQFIHINKCSYKYINRICADYDITGISSNAKTIQLLAEERERIINQYFTKSEIKKALKEDILKLTPLEKIFSIINHPNRRHKVITLFGIHLKIRRKRSA